MGWFPREFVPRNLGLDDGIPLGFGAASQGAPGNGMRGGAVCHTAIIADADLGALAPNIGPPGAGGGVAQTRAFIAPEVPLPRQGFGPGVFASLGALVVAVD